jgi:hypothetical protein
VPVYRYSLKLLCTIDLGLFRGEGFKWSRDQINRGEDGESDGDEA